MVRPGRGPDQHARLRVGGRNQLEAKPQRSAATGSLQSGNPVVVGMLAKQDRADQFGEALVARASEIRLGFLRLEQDALGILDHREDRRSALSVAENADADIDLLRPRIRVAERDQRKQRVALNRWKIGQPSGARVGFAQHETRLARLGVVIHCDPVADRDGLAGQDVARRDLFVGKAVARGHLDLAAGDLGPAGRADAGLAGEGRRKAG